MHLEIVSPEKTLFTGDVTSVHVPGTEGSFQILNNHAPIVSTLKKGEITIEGEVSLEDNVPEKFYNLKKDKKITSLEIESGLMEMKKNSIKVLID